MRISELEETIPLSTFCTLTKLNTAGHQGIFCFQGLGFGKSMPVTSEVISQEKSFGQKSSVLNPDTHTHTQTYPKIQRPHLAQ